ncbi:MAG: hypothetical protein LBU14_05245 [Candidatus Peribacteria bacterium]|jgi:predicted  nucleic acid-binding Zn-ribbon protein|nr:hypothetical protein [Candidatus Peribacteria bacterium]
MQKAIKEGKYNKLITNYDKKIKETEDKFVHEKDLEQKNKLDILLKVWISSKKNFEKAKLEVEEENERMITQLKQKRREYVNYINENKEHYKRVKNDMKIYQNIQKLLEAIKNIDKKISFLSKPI